MSIFNTPSKITITCHKWHAPYLEKEVLELGYQVEHSFVTGVKLLGNLNDCIRLNMNLNCASQVLFSLGQFSASNASEVYQFVRNLAWEEYIDSKGYFTVTSNVKHPTIKNSMFANVKVKDAIADRFMERYAERPSSGSEFRGAVVHLFWNEYGAEIFLDTSGESLARHGYRKIPGRAPMLEALASATILASRWDKDSPFINPMCGSGTLAIEAALLASNTKPGIHRDHYAFMHLKGYDDELYLSELNALEEAIHEDLTIEIIASDIDEDAVNNARKNAIAAGVAQYIRFEVCDFRDATIPETPGVLFINPEYGERLGELEELTDTYKEIGDFMKKKCGGYLGYIFTGNLDLAKKIGLKAKKRTEFFTGKIDCRLLEYELYQGSRDK
ncbi:putative N6-adenine-specific DNA methylase [Dyadobacter jejuensis]|uniref:Putative N6-adenine-specific DNA methylase n=1 Tax=Dyadobacter jejuensis TaxID=1082580 RepID=A0A316AMQ7_9BACT|nr:RNA methyltransferase [Dyadobacter jejuensis]PWJ58856.1 putative N6-adenine-specific DNA methylase [Dyadobacter jejuensis]